MKAKLFIGFEIKLLYVKDSIYYKQIIKSAFIKNE